MIVWGRTLLKVDRFMNFFNKVSNRLDRIKKIGFCPSILNMGVERYSFMFLLNDILSGIRIFCLVFPIIISIVFFFGGSPTQGVISCIIASIFSIFFGGSKYQISSISIPLCVVTFEILSKYQYKGLLYVSLFASIILIIFGILRFSSVIKHISTSFLAASIVYVCVSIIIDQIQYILSINTLKSTNGLFENFDIFMRNIDKISIENMINALCFLVPLFVIRLKFKGYTGYFIYLILGILTCVLLDFSIIPDIIKIKTIGREIVASSSFDNILSISRDIPSQIFLVNTLNYAFVIAIILALEVGFSMNVSSSITGNKDLQTNIEIISNGISNFMSISMGGFFVSPDVSYTLKNIEYKSKTVISILILCILLILCYIFSDIIVKYIPVYCISSILIVFSMQKIFEKKILRFLKFKNNDSYIFIITMITLLYFGFIPSIIIGFLVSLIFFAQRMIKIKDASVHTTKNHDTGAIEFMLNKNGFSRSKNIPDDIMDKIEVIQINNILFLNIAKLVEEGLGSRGKFPTILIIYFNNIPFLDTEALNSLKELISNAKKRDCMVIVSGTNGMLLSILEQKQQLENSGQVFGYIVPNFSDAIKETLKRLKV